ncbi:MAG: hypothetical protein LLF89_03530 [Spirochaetaceae bacterium]|nr:hypothetical protein [Spirochaetaceae bacterium]
MDLSRFPIQEKLRGIADIGSTYLSVFYEKLLSGLFEENENLLVRTDIQKDRDRIFMFPAFHWLTQPNGVGDNFRVLYVVSNEDELKQAQDCALTLGSGLEEQVSLAVLDGAQALPAGIGKASLVIATMQTLSEILSGPDSVARLAPRHFGFVIIDSAEKIAEMPDEKLRRVQGHLLPSWERKTLVIEGKNTPRSKAFAWDIADNPKEVRLQESIGLVGTIHTVSYEIKEEEKLRFVLGLAADPAIQHICLFCNLKNTAIELSKRLALNGVPTDYIAGSLQPGRKRQILEKALFDAGAVSPVAHAASSAVSQEPGARESTNGSQGNQDAGQTGGQAAQSSKKAFVLVLTDDGAKDLEKAKFPVVVNFDIPLEPEFYAERLGFLDQQNLEACLYNLACERYMYGIPAIRRSLDPTLSLSPFEGLDGLPKDLSEGVVIRRESPWDDDRRGGDRRRDSRDQRGPRNLQSRPRQGQRRPTSGQSSQAGQSGQSGRSPDRRPSGSGSPEAANLYSMTMEERMTLYREKYGGNLPRQETGLTRQQAAAAGREGRAEKEGEASRGARDVGEVKPGATQAEPERPASNRPEVNQQAANSGKTPADKGHSFLEKLHGLLGSQKE